MNEREQKTSPFFPVVSLNLFFHRIPRNSTNNTRERPGTAAPAVENCQWKSKQLPKHKQTCYSDMELAAKLPGFYISLVPFKTYIEKKVLQYVNGSLF